MIHLHASSSAMQMDFFTSPSWAAKKEFFYLTQTIKDYVV